ncbi:MAG: hypothetical protein EHM35_00525 [Planctomycetaceae bacterium]|nr:MAG: hypothetical protein EHM35_00525 [Planctomycetaceae bacterium]
MSAYVVEDKTINRIVDFFYTKLLGDRFYWPARGITEAGYDLDKREDRERLASAMFALNVEAVNARYPDSAEQFRPLNFTYCPTPAPLPVSAYKSLRCWLYQCSEGNVPKTDLYKLMDEASKLLAMQIVDDSPAYQAAGWD